MSIPIPPDATPQGNPADHPLDAPASASIPPYPAVNTINTAGTEFNVSAPGGVPLAPQKTKAPRNTVGLIALITAIVGFIFACIPGALIVGWILLPIAFVLSLVSFFMKGKRKGLGVTALVLSVVGTVVGFVVFFSVIVTGLDEAFSGGETSISTPAEQSVDNETISAEEGTRENPLPIGSTITQGDWAVTIDSVNLNATDAIAAENQFNDPAPEGSVYVLVSLTATYNGSDADGDLPMVSVEFVTPGGNTLKSYDSMVVAPSPFDSMTTLYSGASTSGNMEFTVPVSDTEAGTLAVTPHMFGDKVFFATK